MHSLVDDLVDSSINFSVFLGPVACRMGARFRAPVQTKVLGCFAGTMCCFALLCFAQEASKPAEKTNLVVKPSIGIDFDK